MGIDGVFLGRGRSKVEDSMFGKGKERERDGERD